MLVILVGLDGNGRQSRIALDALGLPQVAMARGEAAVEQLQNIDLTAGGGKAVEIKVVDVDIALPVCLGMLRAQQIHLIIGLCTSRADLEHRAHGGIAVDIGVVPLHIADPSIDIGNLVDGLHQGCIGLPRPGSVRSVQNVRLGRGREAMVH